MYNDSFAMKQLIPSMCANRNEYQHSKINREKH